MSVRRFEHRPRRQVEVQQGPPNADSMFIFRSRRSTLTKRLLKARKRRSANDNGESVMLMILKELQDNQLGMLWTAVDSRGQDLSNCNCVLLRRDLQPLPHVLCCQAWRWPDIRYTNELRRLPICRSASDPVYICCNPYHWSRVYQPGESSHVSLVHPFCVYMKPNN